MIVINARNVNDAYVQGMTMINAHGRNADSRNGPVKVMETPVTTVYTRPTERVLFDPRRDANPFFHLFEALWMLNGSNDLETLTRFVPSFAQFSDDGQTLHGAYGYRWRHWRKPRWSESDAMLVDYQSLDQLAVIINMLRTNPNDRRAIITMWDPTLDLGVQSKDIPCNDTIDCQIVDGRLNIIVFCRSNDIVYGAYGANAVHMSMLHEYLATMIGVPVGTYSQISCNFHAYLETPYRFASYFPLNLAPLYGYGGFVTIPLVDAPSLFDTENRWFMRHVRRWEPITAGYGREFENFFFVRVAWPMYSAIRLHKEGKTRDAIALLDNPINIDWLSAGRDWLVRRLEKKSVQ